MAREFLPIDPFEERTIGEDDFSQRLERVSGIEGFFGEKRSDSVLENIGLEFKELAQSYGMLGKALFENPIDTVVNVGKNLPEALVDSYTRWYDAYNEGVLGDSIAAYPVQFVQDMTLPISIFFGGVAGIAGKGGQAAGKVGRLSRLTGIHGGERTFVKALKTVALTSDAFGIVTEPFSGLIGAGARRVVSPILAKQLQKRNIIPEQITKSNVPDIDIIDELNTKSEPGKTSSRMERIKTELGDVLEDEISVADVPRGSEFNNRERGYKDVDEMLPVEKSILDDSKISGNPTMEEMGIKLSDITDEKSFNEVMSKAFDFDKARRGVRTHQQTQAAADAIKGTAEDFLGRPLGKAFNSDQALATAPIVNGVFLEGSELAKKVEFGGLEADFEFMKMVTKAVAVTEQFTGVTAEAGRALNIFKKIPKETKLRAQFMREILDKHGGTASVKDLAKAWILADNQVALARTLGKAKEGGFKNMAIEAWINGLLSAPPTQVVNLASNAVVAGWAQGIENIGTAAIGGLRKVFGGKNTMSAGE